MGVEGGTGDAGGRGSEGVDGLEASFGVAGLTVTDSGRRAPRFAGGGAGPFAGSGGASFAGGSAPASSPASPLRRRRRRSPDIDRQSGVRD